MAAPSSRRPAAHDDAIAVAWNANEQASSIARRCGISEASVYRIARDLGLTPRSGRGARSTRVVAAAMPPDFKSPAA